MMKKLLLLLVSVGITAFASGSSAAAAPPALRSVLEAARAAVPVPEEWSGIWATLDTIYICPNELLTASAGLDTLCAGVDYSQDVPGDIEIQCTGTADGTTIDMTCTGLMQVDEDCEALYTIEIDGTRTADSYRTEAMITVQYQGEGVSCEFLPDQCFRMVSEGTRTGPAPQVYCSTPVLPSTWGRLKAHYR